MKVSNISVFGSVGRILCIFKKIYASVSPIPTPPMHIQIKLPAASYHTNCPVAAAIIANRKIISEEASFSKLSPSRIEASLFGTFTNFRIAPALTASGGETIPPNKNPKAKENPGIK
ncbi:hypothetical protein D3C80_1685730 [compost metagenome]